MSNEQPTYDGVELVEAIFAVEQAIEALAPFDISTSHIEQTLLHDYDKIMERYASNGNEI